MTVMIQKEVAARMAAKPGSKDYGVLSVLVQALSSVKIISYVPPGAFLPPPKVHSAIVKIAYNPEKETEIQSKTCFRELVSRLFRHRRKTLRGGWIRMLPEDQQVPAGQILNKLKIDPTRRPETLTVSDFVNLANQVFAAGLKS